MKNLKIACWATIGPKRIYEIHDEDNRFFGFVNVDTLQKMGYVKRIDHTKKVNEFIGTPEGVKWVEQNRFFNAI